VLNRSLSSFSSLYGWGSCLALLSYLVPFMFNKVMYGYWPLIRIACLAKVRRAVRFFITKVSLFAYGDPVNVSLHDALAVEAGRLHFRFF
jgi:hypothetical protein